MQRFMKAIAAIMLTVTAVVCIAGCTKTKVPTVETMQASGIAATEATVGGFITSDGGADIIERGVCWGKEANPDVSANIANAGTGVGSFTCTITGLEPATTYYARAYAFNSVGVAYGMQTSFTTLEEGGSGGSGGNGGEGAEDTLPTVVTMDVGDITQTEATCWGLVTSEGSTSVTERGFCWGTTDGPTVASSHISTSGGTGNFASNLTGLTPGTVYHVRAYATNSEGTAYGNEKTFTTLSGGGGGELNDHEYVDLGLPSGTLWATCNVGATTPEDYGDYYAWGETEPKTTYNWSTYQYCMGSIKTLTKYCNFSSCGYNGFTDNLTELQSGDDPATAHWGSEWCTPTKAQWEELCQNTTSTWTTQNGVNGRLFTATNGNSLFLPAAGYRWDSELREAGSWGDYWSRSLYTGNPNDVWHLYFDSDHCGMLYYDRGGGFPVRPVCQK